MREVETVVERCEYCYRDVDMSCRGTRCMEGGDRECFDALMRFGGGEYTVNQGEALRRQAVFNAWRANR
jgi:hypothetical protein